jgi:hypothetical protein
MKKLLTGVGLILLLSSCAGSSSIFELNSNQSMSITGKGPGQDAAINPYGEGESIAVVQNKGTVSFNVRIQKSGVIIEEVAIEPKSSREFMLKPGTELYLDSITPGKAKVTFKKA